MMQAAFWVGVLSGIGLGLVLSLLIMPKELKPKLKISQQSDAEFWREQEEWEERNLIP